MIELKATTTTDLLTEAKEGMVAIGTGGDPNDWIEGINKMMVDEEVTSNPEIFTDIRSFDIGDLHYLVFMFPEPEVDEDFNVGRLAMVRLANGEFLKWLSDFKVNTLGDGDGVELED